MNRGVGEMEFIIQMIGVIEIIMMNMYIFSKNVKRRYSLITILFVISIYTMILIFIGVKIIQILGIYGNGNGLFTLLGFFYLIPLHFLFEGNTTRHFIVICSVWIYTLIVFSISMQFMHFPFSLNPYLVVVIVETFLFICTYHYVNRFISNVYIYLLDCSEESIQKYLRQASLSWFLLAFLINLHFVFNDSAILKIATMIVVSLTVIFQFHLIFDILKNRSEIGSLEMQVAKDNLTGLGNRIAFSKSIDELIHKKQSFYLIYLDLNNFKGINDQFGHLVGDQYLITFSRKIQFIADKDCAFRISGDEFIILDSNSHLEYILESLSKIDFILSKPSVVFRGVSYGWVEYPKDAQMANELLHMADQRMYVMKEKNGKL